MTSLKHLLSAKARSQSGCYTCRLRRKKCDERRPVCQACSALEITCFFGDAKPEWMDGGARQREMAEFVKAQVKKQASQRRDRKYLEALEVGTRKVNLSDGDEAPPPRAGNESASGPSTRESPNSHVSSSATASASPPEVPWHNQLFVREDEGSGDDDENAHIHYACIYLDYVFPHLYPHYRPHILVGGRGWVLDALQSNNKSLFYITMSLSAYYFAVILHGGDVDHRECTERLSGKLQSQMELGLRELQREVSSLDHGKADAREGLVVMQSMIQLLIFEVATGNRENWRVHLDAAICLFRQILPNPDDWTEMLRGLYSKRWPPPAMQQRPWCTPQAACRFFTANLFYIDVLSSIPLGCAPRLQDYQPAIIPSFMGTHWCPSSLSEGPLHMEEFRGLHNWVIQIIGDISALYAWKKAQSQAGSLSTDELISRGGALSAAIDGGLQTIDVSCRRPDTAGTIISSPIIHDQPSYAVHNIIWLNAALIYLNVVVSGWRPSCPEMISPVSKTTELLYDLQRGTCLGALAWPFCISGCLAPPEDELKYREMVSRTGALQSFGTLREAMKVLEEVWARRPLAEDWDVARCMNILGHGALLV